MKKTLAILLSLLLLTACGDKKITIAEAGDKAFTYAGLTKESAVIKSTLETEDYYQFNIESDGQNQYVKVDKEGELIAIFKDDFVEGHVLNSENEVGELAKEMDLALTSVLNEFGLKREDVANIEVSQKNINGETLYSVDFMSEGKEYEALFDASKSEIKFANTEVSDDLFQKVEATLTIEEALVKALNVNGVDFKQTSNISVKLEKALVATYVVEYNVDNFEYEIQLNAENGEIISQYNEISD